MHDVDIEQQVTAATSAALTGLMAAVLQSAGEAPEDHDAHALWLSRVDSLAAQSTNIAVRNVRGAIEGQIDLAHYLATFTEHDGGDDESEKDKTRRVISGEILGCFKQGPRYAIVFQTDYIHPPAVKLSFEEAAQRGREAVVNKDYAALRSENKLEGIPRGPLNAAGIERFLTDYTSTEQAASVYAAAKTNIGRRVRLYRETINWKNDKEGTQGKLKVCRHIQPLGADEPVVDQRDVQSGVSQAEEYANTAGAESAVSTTDGYSPDDGFDDAQGHSVPANGTELAEWMKSRGEGAAEYRDALTALNMQPKKSHELSADEVRDVHAHLLEEAASNW